MASRSHFAAPLLLVVFIGLIVYVSLFPFRFDPHGPTMFEAVRLLTWMRASRGDMFNNVLLYAPLGFCCLLLLEPRFGRVTGMVIATIAGAALSCSMELLQASVPTRVTSLTDLSLNTLGTLVGAVLGSTWHIFGARMAPQSAARGRSGAVALTIVVLWLVARLWPLLPDPGLRQLKRAVRPLLSPRVELAGLFEHLGQPADDVVHLNHGVAEDSAGRRLAGVLAVGVIVEVASPRAVVQEPRAVHRGCFAQKRLTVFGPILI